MPFSPVGAPDPLLAPNLDQLQGGRHPRIKSCAEQLSYTHVVQAGKSAQVVYMREALSALPLPHGLLGDAKHLRDIELRQPGAQAEVGQNSTQELKRRR